jgi:hypothetical protein
MIKNRRIELSTLQGTAMHISSRRVRQVRRLTPTSCDVGRLDLSKPLCRKRDLGQPDATTKIQKWSFLKDFLLDALSESAETQGLFNGLDEVDLSAAEPGNSIEDSEGTFNGVALPATAVARQRNPLNTNGHATQQPQILPTLQRRHRARPGRNQRDLGAETEIPPGMPNRTHRSLGSRRGRRQKSTG